MKFTEIDIPEAVLDKLVRKQHVSEREVREVLRSRPMIRFREKGHRKGEDLYLAMGQTDAGRYVTIFFIRKSAGRALIISARDMDQKERKLYGKK
jgi:hypothetical protein